ncbi:MAG: phosphoribosylanthranilate isomerase [Thermodesulfobacteriota bacterium]|nr:phosphoribosylanthranilate isomerase [Thermodesulfobacteriota bacterium]
MNRIKICGITNIDDAILCSDVGIDFIGLNFYSKSKRFIDLKKAELLINKLSSEILKVGVFVNEDIAIINNHVRSLELDYVQLHGEEPPETIDKIQCKVIKAFSAKQVNLFEYVSHFNTEYWLFDSSDTEQRGGTGEVFDWNTISDIVPREKLILSGGLNESNIQEAMERTKINFVDICSGVELSPGKKDVKKLESVVRLVKHG